LKIKTLKKRLYLGCAKFMHLYKGVLWQASSGYEKEDILQVFGSRLDSDSVHVAPNLAADAPLNPHVMPSLPKRPDHARIIFLSRIARKKNLKFALSCLQQVSGTVTFDIYGPIEDEAYWQACQTVTKSLPGNVKVSYKGVVSPKQVDDVFGRYHLFLFPTWGENFGHVIFESLRAGCPVLISDQTPWRDLTEHTAGWAVPLSEPEQFQRRLNRLVAMHDADFRDWSRGAQEYAATFAGNPSLVKANRALFLKALAR
jgi:glycosyltransferase involved in cell wall biosynthesis